MPLNRLLWLFFRVVRKLLRMAFKTKPSEIKNVRVTGRLDKEELELFIRKVRWYAPDRISFYVSSGYEADLPDNVFLNEKADYDYYLLSSKWHIFPNLLRLERAAVIDPLFYSTEECVAWSYLYGLVVGESPELNIIFRTNFMSLAEKLKDKRNACCFLTGQSFDGYRDHPETKDMVKVICNSVVKNDKFMEFNNPDILVFADPVYHFSWDEYAENFRKDVIKTAEKYDVYIMMPYNMTALMLAHFPQIKDRLIGVRRSAGFNFPYADDISSFITDNILTYLMLPAASAFADTIYILGADGRSPGDKMFWKHNSSVQYGSLMQSVADAHPSFFRDRNYVQYQQDHDNLMEDLLEYGEAKGKKYISLNKSYLKSINSRYTED